MNNLKKEIWDRYGNFELSHDKNKLIVENINEFVEKHCIEFCNFMAKSEYHTWNEGKTWHKIENLMRVEVTTEELFNLYIETL